MGFFGLLYFAWLVIAIVQEFLSYGTAYRYTKANGDNGVSLYGWFILFSLAALVPGLGIYLWKNSKDHGSAGSSSTYYSEPKNIKKCPSCQKEINDYRAVFCQYCGTEIQGKKVVQTSNDTASGELPKNLSDIFNDESVMKEAKELNRIYGKSVAVDFLKNKAGELGLGEVEINENDIE